MKSFAALIFSYFLFLAVQAQDAGGQQNSSASGFGGSAITTSFGQTFLDQAFNGTYEDTEFSYSKIKGTPFFNDEVISSRVTLNDGSVVKDAMIQLDLYANDFVLTKPDGEKIILDELFFYEVRMMPTNGEEYVFNKIGFEDPDQFYQILFKNDIVQFFKREYVTLREGEGAGLSKIDAKFNKRQTYFIKYKEGHVREIKLKDKDVFSAFPRKEVSELKNFAKRNKLKLKKEEDVIKLLKGVLS